MGRHSAMRWVSGTRIRRHGGRSLSVGTAVAALVVGGVAFAPAASAAVLTTTTTVTASPATSVKGTAVTLTASVFLKPVGGVMLTPAGQVSFFAKNGAAQTPLGSAKLGTCLLTTCKASITSTAIPAGTTSVQGVYSGDVVAGSSQGTAPVTVTDPSTQTVTCQANTSCQATATVTSADGTTTLTVTADPSASNQTVHADLVNGQQLHCPGDSDPVLGGLGTFTSTATDAGKTIDYTGSGNVGAQMYANYAAHTLYVGCFASDTQFMGYINGVYQPAQLVIETSGTFYEAQLGNCANNSGQKPCAQNVGGTGPDTYRIMAGPGDPKFIG